LSPKLSAGSIVIVPFGSFAVAWRTKTFSSKRCARPVVAVQAP
jgi:hypothetical protein